MLGLMAKEREMSTLPTLLQRDMAQFVFTIVAWGPWCMCIEEKVVCSKDTSDMCI